MVRLVGIDRSDAQAIGPSSHTNAKRRISLSAKWLESLNVDPIPALLGWEHPALGYYARRDLLGESVEDVETLWDLPEASHLAKKQLPDGSWKYGSKGIDPDTGQNYFLLETFRNLRILVEIYGFSAQHATLNKAAEYLFSLQTNEGDIRGILGNQYMPYYLGEILACLIKAGYSEDKRVMVGLDWLLSMRQDDGGWIVPTQAIPSRERDNSFWTGDPVQPDRSLPHAHLATGMVLRAFAAHPDYQSRPEVLQAGDRLKERFYQSDKYHDRKAKSYWLKFQFPFWWSNLLTALDTLEKLGYSREDPDIHHALAWFCENQESDGLWPTGYGSGQKAEENRRWVGLAICRMLRAYYATRLI
jgi:hypothetical protein